MACWTDEVETYMNPAVVVGVERPFDLQLFLQVSLELCVDVVHHSLEAVLLVDLVSVTNSIHDRQLNKIQIRYNYISLVKPTNHSSLTKSCKSIIRF